MKALRGVGNILSSLLLLVGYIKLVQIVYALLRLGIPYVVFETWRSYIFLGLMATAIDALFMFVLWGIGWIASHFYRPRLFRIIGCIASAIAFILSEIELWRFISALYYAGFWEYFWGCFLSVAILLPYIGLPGFVFYSPSSKKEEES